MKPCLWAPIATILALPGRITGLGISSTHILHPVLPECRMGSKLSLGLPSRLLGNVFNILTQIVAYRVGLSVSYSEVIRVDQMDKVDDKETGRNGNKGLFHHYGPTTNDYKR